MPSDQEFLANNRRVVATFRANAGVVDGLFPVLLLTTTGARTGRKTTSPLAYGTDDGTVFVVASKAGAPTNPAWFHNVSAHPQVTVEIGLATYEATATVAEPTNDNASTLRSRRRIRCSRSTNRRAPVPSRSSC